MEIIKHPRDIDFWVSLLDEQCGLDEHGAFYAAADGDLYFVMDSECQIICVATKAVAEWLVRLINEYNKRSLSFLEEGDT